MSKAIEEQAHITVLGDEAVSMLQLVESGKYIDATLGLGGHTVLILERINGARVLGIDQDEEALGKARERLARFGDRIEFAHGNFADVQKIAKSVGYEQVEGIVADLGVSSMQMDSESRGFSFRFDARLDMRMDESSDAETAADVLMTRSAEEIADIIYKFGEERASRKIARRIVEAREQGRPVLTTFELKSLVERCVRRGKNEKINPATRTFQALRIFVNKELESLETFLDGSVELLKPGGRLAIITFHSLEDRIVKHKFQRLSGRCQCPPRMPVCICGAKKVLEIITRKPITPTDAEIEQNARARSAKLRVAEKI